MAASDPATDVPTPTGTLQGVAAFSWDGSAWQPSGRAGPSVATPTGVLRGVAAFNGGPAWQPAGLAQPGVATPTGTLDGVAVYTWTGDSWAPPGGTATPSTPHGALRGVAAFNWDGAAWQPAAQAGPSVATPYGVLDGVAMFGWSGSAWAATGAPTLSLDFMQPGVLDPRITFTRASTATYFDATGIIQTAAINAPRWDYHPVTHALLGLLVEYSSANYLLNSATLSTQSVAVTAQPYTLSFYGTGTITMSGAFAGSLVGGGAFPQRVSTTFTPAAGTLTCTVTGSVLDAQLEPSAFVTSYIPTTTGAVGRATDTATMATTGWLNATVGSLAVAFNNLEFPGGAGVNNGLAVLDDGTGNRNNTVEMFAYPNTVNDLLMAYNIYAVGAAGGVGGAFNSTNVAVTAPGFYKTAWSWGLPTMALSFNGGAIQSAALTMVPPISRLTIGLGYGGISAINGRIQRVTYWPRVLSTAELQAAAT